MHAEVSALEIPEGMGMQTGGIALGLAARFLARLLEPRRGLEGLVDVDQLLGDLGREGEVVEAALRELDELRSAPERRHEDLRAALLPAADVEERDALADAVLPCVAELAHVRRDVGRVQAGGNEALARGVARGHADLGVDAGRLVGLPQHRRGLHALGGQRDLHSDAHGVDGADLERPLVHRLGVVAPRLEEDLLDARVREGLGVQGLYGLEAHRPTRALHQDRVRGDAVEEAQRQELFPLLEVRGVEHQAEVGGPAQGVGQARHPRLRLRPPPGPGRAAPGVREARRRADADGRGEGGAGGDLAHRRCGRRGDVGGERRLRRARGHLRA
mmetsp:Transcript_49288/g.114567  ORF Transcript_49288/g.114567 Transcript_49288/m.114567 type:complete len:331 (-) Transcript_49288:117-1109(-)